MAQTEEGTRWWTYVQRVTDSATGPEISDKIGIDRSNVSRWRNGSRPDVAFALKFARAYERPVIEALVEAEFITDAEAEVREVRVGIDQYSNAELAGELYSRLK